MSQTTTPSGADVLAILDAEIRALPVMAEMMRHGNHSCDERPAIENMKQARTAVAALIARNAELEAERASITRMWDQAGKDSIKVSINNSHLLSRVQEQIQRATKAESERDALAAENKALREGLEEARRVHFGQRHLAVTDSDKVMWQVVYERYTKALARTTAKGNDDG